MNPADNADVPIYKAGMVAVRALHSTNPLICLTQVYAKNPQDQDRVRFGLPKGTRQYRDPVTNAWMDARNARDALTHRARLEPLVQTVQKEAHHEMGMDAAAFSSCTIRALGPRRFFSQSSGDAYDIAWYVTEVADAVAARFDPKPAEAKEVRWTALSEIREMDARGAMNPSYAAVVEEAVERMKANDPALQPIGPGSA